MKIDCLGRRYMKLLTLINSLLRIRFWELGDFRKRFKEWNLGEKV